MMAASKRESGPTVTLSQSKLNAIIESRLARQTARIAALEADLADARARIATLEGDR